MDDRRLPCEPQHPNGWSLGGLPKQFVSPRLRSERAAECHPNTLPRKVTPVTCDRQALGPTAPKCRCQPPRQPPPDGWNFRIGAQGLVMGTSTRGHRGQDRSGAKYYRPVWRPLAAWKKVHQGCVKAAPEHPSLFHESTVSGQLSGFDAWPLRELPSAFSVPLPASGLARNHQTATHLVVLSALRTMAGVSAA